MDKANKIAILVINLPQSKQRRAVMEKNLNQLELEYEIFPAVDGRSMGVDHEDIKK